MTSAISTNTSPILKNIINSQPLKKQTPPSPATTPTQESALDRDVFLKEYIKEKEKESVKTALIQTGGSIATAAIVLYYTGTLLKGLTKNPSKPPKGIGNIWEDINKALSKNQMSLPKELDDFLTKITKIINNPQEISQKGGEPIKSILLYGPPGTGKTTFAKAFAKEFEGARFATLDVTNLGSKFVGETEKNIQAAVNQICEEAQKNPDTKFFVFIDEIDSVMMVDNGNLKKHSNDVLNEFKRCFTERLGKHDNIITIGATNLSIDPETGIAAGGKVLDKPMLDRFQEKIYVGLPTKEQILDTFIRNYMGKTMVCDELKDKASKELNIICEFLSNKKHEVSFRTLKALFNNIASISKTGEKVSVEDVFNAIKSKKADLKISDIELQKLAQDLNITQ